MNLCLPRFAIATAITGLAALACAQTQSFSFQQSSSAIGGGGSIYSSPIAPYVANETASVNVDPHFYAGSASLTGSWVFTVTWNLAHSINPPPTVTITYMVPEYASALAQCQPQGSSDVASSSDLSTSASQAVPPPPSGPVTSSANKTWSVIAQNVVMAWSYSAGAWTGTATVASVSLSTNGGQSGPGAATGNGQSNIASFTCTLVGTP